MTTADRTAGLRVRRYRAAQKAEREIVRADLQIPARSVGDLKATARALRERYRKAAQAKPVVDLVLATVNAPRPQDMDARTLVHCLSTPLPEPQWFPHVEALFDEVSAEALHDLVLAGVVDFEDLYRASRTWRITDGRNLAWIKEMADLGLERPVGRHDPAH